MKNFDALKIGLIGLVIVFLINLIVIFFFKKNSSEFFTDNWWTSWFTTYLVWIVFIIIGIGQKLKNKA